MHSTDEKVAVKLRFDADTRSCLICKNSTNNRRFLAAEKMFGNGGQFDYMECASCKAIMLMTVPADMSPYYPSDYYAYEEEGTPASIKTWIKDQVVAAVIAHRTGKRTLLGAVLAKATGKFRWVRQGMFHAETSILDVGCGSGTLLKVLQGAGFKDLTGADVFIAKDLDHGNGLRIHKKELKDMDRAYGFIMMNHTFEHLPEPEEVLRTIASKLEADGRALIRIPIADCFAWREYGIDWVQLDAPRHLFLHTKKSMEHMVSNTDLVLEHVEYDSTEFQFVGSEKYRRGLPLSASLDQLEGVDVSAFKWQAEALDRNSDGDTASFYFRKKA